MSSTRSVGPRRRRRFLAFLFAAVAAISLCLPQAGIASSCPSGHKIDYLAPLQKLPKVRRIPQNGRLAFAPSHLVVRPPADLLAGGGRLGFVFESDGPHKSFRLGWTVTFVIQRISSSGRTLRTVGRKRIRFSPDTAWRRPIHFGFAIPKGRRGVYRSSLTIDRARHSPITFSEYTRVLPVRVDVALRLSAPSYLPGDSLAARLENHGTTWVTYGPGIYLEMWDGARWKPEDEEGKTFPPVGISIAPGSFGACERLLLPADLPAGRYRIEKRLAISKVRVVRAYFDVL